MTGNAANALPTFSAQLHAGMHVSFIMQVQEVATGSDGSQDVISSSQATKK